MTRRAKSMTSFILKAGPLIEKVRCTLKTWPSRSTAQSSPRLGDAARRAFIADG
jgi:hypothetical protein